MKILVIGGDNFQALRLVRDLGRRNSVSVAGYSKLRTLASLSRYSDDHIDFDEFDMNSMEVVIQYIREQGVDLVIPTTERSCIIVNNYREVIEKQECNIACSRMDKLEVAFNKRLTFEFCSLYGIPTPKVFDKVDLSVRPQLLVRKPISSNKQNSDGTLVRTGSPSYYKTWDELPDFNPEYIVQEFIEGESIGFFALCANGIIQTSYSHQRILDTNPSGSGSCVRKSITAPDDSLSYLSGKILKNLKWDGPVMLEFLLDKNGKLYLLEINGRLWGSFCLAPFSGIPFSNMLVSHYAKSEWRAEMKENLGDIIVVNEILLVSRWLQILRGKPVHSSTKFPKRFSIIYELRYMLKKKEIISDMDPLPLFRFLWKK